MKTKILSALVLWAGMTLGLSAQKVTVNLQKAKLGQVLSEITSQTGYDFAYSRPTVNPDKIVSIQSRDEDIQTTLAKLFKGENLTYEIKDKRIFIKEKDATNESKKPVVNKTVKGIVVDEKGEPVIGASVSLKGTDKGTITDFDGNFSLDIPSDGTLNISYLGYQTQQLAANDKNISRITLLEDSKAIDEVVVVGYGSIKKANLSGAVDQISSKQLEHRVSGNSGQILQGIIPNLNVSFSDGGINQKASFDVRGVGSINGGKPLILIDGVEGDLNYINPKDIESISVLKDASSAAIYGARASFGVVLVTTKNPNKGKIKINYSNHFGWSKPTINTDNFITDGLEWARLSDKLSLLENTSTYLGYTEEDYAYMEARKKDPSLPDVLIKTIDGVERYVHYGNTDWWKYIYQNSQPSMEHNLNVSGGSDNIKFYLSGRYYSREGIYRINPDKLQSYTLRSKIDFQILKNLSVTNSTNIYLSDYNYPATNTRNVGGSNNSEDWRKYTFHASPVFLPKNPDGSILMQGAYSPGRDIADGTFADLTYGKSKGLDKEFDVSNTISVKYTPVKNLDLNADYSFRKGAPTSQLLLISTPHTNQPNGEGVSLYKPNTELYKEMHWQTMYQALNAFATYSKSINDKHEIKAMAGFNQEWRRWERSVARRNSPVSEELGSFNLANGENIQVQGNADEWAIRAGFGRLNYDFLGRYLFEVNGRFDLSSKFPHSKRLGIFPSGSFAWRVSEEKFFDFAKAYVSNFKLRASYGTLGNQNVGPYDYIAKMKVLQGNYLFGGLYNSYLSTPEAISANFTWEKSETLNFGIDFALLNNRFTTSFDVYQRNTTDMLTQGKKLPSVFGAAEPLENAADLRTNGFELSVKWQDQFKLAGKPFEYNIGITLADNYSYITKFDNPDGQIDQFYNGKRLGEIWGYSIDGFFLTDDEYLTHADQTKVNRRIKNNYLINHPVAGDLKFRDTNGDGEISPGALTLDDHGDLKIIGNTNPRYSTSFNLGFSHRGFDFSAFFQGILKRDWWPGKDNGFFWGPYTRQYQNFYPKSIEANSWTPENQNAYFPRLAVYAANEGGNYEGAQLRVYSDKYLQNAAFIRLKDITIGYSLPQNVIKKIGFSGIRFYVSGQNLLTFSPIYKHNPDRTIDPEQLGDGNAYPFSKTFAFGIDLKF